MDNDEPVGRKIGSRVSPNDLVTVGYISRTICLVVDEQPDGATHVPGDTWVQDLDNDGTVTGAPRLGPPARMTIYKAEEIFVFE